jgi:hypothetical protein
LTIRGLVVIEDDEKKVTKTKQVTTRTKCMGGPSGPCSLLEGFHHTPRRFWSLLESKKHCSLT